MPITPNQNPETTAVVGANFPDENEDDYIADAERLEAKAKEMDEKADIIERERAVTDEALKGESGDAAHEASTKSAQELRESAEELRRNAEAMRTGGDNIAATKANINAIDDQYHMDAQALATQAANEGWNQYDYEQQRNALLMAAQQAVQGQSSGFEVAQDGVAQRAKGGLPMDSSVVVSLLPQIAGVMGAMLTGFAATGMPSSSPPMGSSVYGSPGMGGGYGAPGMGGGYGAPGMGGYGAPGMGGYGAPGMGGGYGAPGMGGYGAPGMGSYGAPGMGGYGAPGMGAPGMAGAPTGGPGSTNNSPANRIGNAAGRFAGEVYSTLTGQPNPADQNPAAGTAPAGAPAPAGPGAPGTGIPAPHGGPPASGGTDGNSLRDIISGNTTRLTSGSLDADAGGFDAEADASDGSHVEASLRDGQLHVSGHDGTGDPSGGEAPASEDAPPAGEEAPPADAPAADAGSPDGETKLASGSDDGSEPETTLSSAAAPTVAPTAGTATTAPSAAALGGAAPATPTPTVAGASQAHVIGGMPFAPMGAAGMAGAVGGGSAKPSVRTSGSSPTSTTGGAPSPADDTPAAGGGVSSEEAQRRSGPRLDAPMSTITVSPTVISRPDAPLRTTVAITVPDSGEEAPPLLTRAALNVESFDGMGVTLAGGYVRCAALAEQSFALGAFTGAVGAFRDGDRVAYVLATDDALCLLPEGLSLPEGVYSLDGVPEAEELARDVYGRPAVDKLKTLAECGGWGELDSVIEIGTREGMPLDMAAEIIEAGAAVAESGRLTSAALGGASAQLRSRAEEVLGSGRVKRRMAMRFDLDEADVVGDREGYLSAARELLRAELKHAMGESDYDGVRYMLHQMGQLPAE